MIFGSFIPDSSERKKIHSDIDAYVHVPDGTNLDAGTYDEKINGLDLEINIMIFIQE